MRPVESFPLSGHGPQALLPSRGLGTFQPDKKLYPPGSVKQSVLDALKAGYRLIDTSLWYGGEPEVGRAIKESGIRRQDIFVTTKLENTYHAPEDVEAGLEESLKNLELDYVDLYMMHFPYAYAKSNDGGFDTARFGDGKPKIDIELSRAYDVTWKVMEKLVEKRKARYLGVSNFSSPKLKRLLQIATIKPVVNQVEVHPHFPQKGLVKFCQDVGIHVQAFGPLGCMPDPKLWARKGPGPLEDSKIREIAKKYSRTPAQIILCHLICRGLSVIPKSNNPERIEENFGCIFDLDDEDFDAIDNLVGRDGEHGVRNLEMAGYLPFDNFNEEVEEP